MMKIDNILSLVGNTPLLELKNIENKYKLKCRLYAKLENTNVTGSIKVRVAKYIIEHALSSGVINKNTKIMEATSGNMGIALSFICNFYHLPFFAYMPENMSIERQRLMKAYGAEIILTPSTLGMKGAVDALNQSKDKNTFIPSQFENPLNPLIHEKTTAVEINKQLKNIDYIVCSIGSGGTISGIGHYYKNTSTKMIGVEPFFSPLISKNKAGKHLIQGIGANFIPNTLDQSIIDSILTIKDEDAYSGAQELVKEEALLVGISSGCAYKAALKIAKKEKNKKIVFICPDTGEHYLSTANFIK